MRPADKYFVAVPADRVNLLIGNDSSKKTDKCILCGEMHLPEDMSLINDKGTKACPRCVFLIALYVKEGITKKLTNGCLVLSKLNAKFRKIILEEFHPHPKETYRKYLGEMIDAEENRLGIVRLTSEQFTAIQSGEYPFVFLSEEEAEKYKIKPGRVLNLQVGDDGSNRLELSVYSSRLLTVKEAKKHGYKKRKVVCFVTDCNGVERRGEE
jgi:hypothetical protein